MRSRSFIRDYIYRIYLFVKSGMLTHQVCRVSQIYHERTGEKILRQDQNFVKKQPIDMILHGGVIFIIVSLWPHF